MIKVLFDVVQDYYWPSFEPIYKNLQNSKNYSLEIRIGKNQERKFGFLLFSKKRETEKNYLQKGFKITDRIDGFDAVVCGDTLKKPEKYGDAVLCNVDHGPCFKTLRYRNLLKQPKTRYVCFLEGEYRRKRFEYYGLDKIEEIKVIGLPKLDPFFDGTFDRKKIIEEAGLDPSKKTILYAPTYKPTSISMVTPFLPPLAEEFNVIYKLHPYSWSGKYAPRSQHKAAQKAAAENKSLFLVPKNIHSMMKYMYAADVMISEASSVINEFLSLGRCGVIVDLEHEKLRHSDGELLLDENPKDWLSDSFIHIRKGEELEEAVRTALAPSDERKKNIEKDKKYIFEYTDGYSSERFRFCLEELLSHSKKEGK